MSRDERPPYIPLYVLDFVGDANVELMSTEEVGAYFLLLCKAWHQDPPATLPDDDAALAKWARVPPGKWPKIKARVMAPWRLCDGRWAQKRLQQEFKRFATIMEARSQAGKIGNAARWGSDRNRIANGSQTESGRNAVGSHPEPEPEPVVNTTVPPPIKVAPTPPPAPNAESAAAVEMRKIGLSETVIGELSGNPHVTPGVVKRCHLEALDGGKGAGVVVMKLRAEVKRAEAKAAPPVPPEAVAEWRKLSTEEKRRVWDDWVPVGSTAFPRQWQRTDVERALGYERFRDLVKTASESVEEVSQ